MNVKRIAVVEQALNIFTNIPIKSVHILTEHLLSSRHTDLQYLSISHK